MWVRVFLGASAALALLAASAFENEIAQWRQDRESRLKADGGWLTVAGLFWLHPGSNPFGTDPANEIVLPDGPARAGAFQLNGGTVTVTHGVSTRQIMHDSDEAVKVGRLSLFVIRRGD